MENSIIQVKNLSKTFYSRERSANTIRDRVFNLVRGKSQGGSKEIKALKNLNFEIKKGEIFGIIGRNGSGKSTLLNCLMGSIPPDKGSTIKTKGKMIRLALGMGFDPNLSARDNIYVNGTILGLTFKRIGLIFDDIIGFAELEEFVDVPVKNYSSGMMTKLKFAIAVHAEADIFLMDEFFGGVGDESFRKKSDKVFQNTFFDGRTIILVSHSLDKLAHTCSRAMVLNAGNQLLVDNAKQAVAKYRIFLKKHARK